MKLMFLRYIGWGGGEVIAMLPSRRARESGSNVRRHFKGCVPYRRLSLHCCYACQTHTISKSGFYFVAMSLSNSNQILIVPSYCVPPPPSSRSDSIPMMFFVSIVLNCKTNFIVLSFSLSRGRGRGVQENTLYSGGRKPRNLSGYCDVLLYY